MQWRDTLTENKHIDKDKCTVSFFYSWLNPPHLSFLICHIWLLISFMISLCSLPSNLSFSLLSIPPTPPPHPHPPTCCLHSQSPSLPLFLPFLFPSSSPSLSPPSLLRSRLTLIPLAHTLRQHPPLSTSTFTLTSSRLPLSSSRRLPFPSPTNTYHPSHLPVCCLSLSSISSHSSLLLTHSTLRSCQTHTYTHSCWLAPKDRAPSPPNRLPGGSISWPAGFLTLSSAEEEDKQEAMEHSHMFPVFSPNGSTGQNPPEVAQGCPLGPLPVIYYSVLLCLGLPGKRCAQ